MSDEQLIELVERYPLLYDSSLPEYRDLSARNMAWEEIAEELNTTGHDCKARWSKIRNCYTNSRKRRRKKGDHGSTMSPWKFESQMEFLLPHLEIRDTDNNDDAAIQFTDKSEFLDVTDSPITHRSPYRRAKREKDEHHLLDEMMLVVEPPKEIKKKVMELDENDHFFLSMSKQIKRLPVRDQSTIRFQLHKLIHDAEMKTLSSEGHHKFEE